MWKRPKEEIKEFLERKAREKFGEVPGFFVRETDEKFGDYATNIALVLAKKLRKSPGEIWEALSHDLEKWGGELYFSELNFVSGFINFRLRDEVLHSFLNEAAFRPDDFHRLGIGKGIRVNVEFVSANPTGSLNVANARAAAVGDSLVRILRAAGYRADSEYYVNDAGGQIRALGGSILWRLGKREEPPQDGYLGDYLVEIARRLGEAEDELEAGSKAADMILESQMETLRRFRVSFDAVTRESSIRESPLVEEVKEKLEPHVYTSEGALYFRSSQFGDEKDRVLVRNNGEPTYYFFDLVYHYDKFKRGYEYMIDLLGPDHHGHIARMKAGLEAMGIGGDRLEVLIVQQVNLVRGGERVVMSKRKGEFFTMDQLLDEVGVDAARFFFLLRSVSSHLDFDLDLARTLGRENPVYYVQYLHARTRSLLEFASSRGLSPEGADPSKLELPEERTILRKMLFFQDLIEEIARNRSPHLMPHYLLELASLYHNYYQKVRIVTEDERLSKARLLLSLGVGNVVKKGLELIGVEAPERM